MQMPCPSFNQMLGKSRWKSVEMQFLWTNMATYGNIESFHTGSLTVTWFQIVGKEQESHRKSHEEILRYRAPVVFLLVLLPSSFSRTASSKRRSSKNVFSLVAPRIYSTLFNFVHRVSWTIEHRKATLGHKQLLTIWKLTGIRGGRQKPKGLAGGQTAPDSSQICRIFSPFFPMTRPTKSISTSTHSWSEGIMMYHAYH